MISERTHRLLRPSMLITIIVMCLCFFYSLFHMPISRNRVTTPVSLPPLTLIYTSLWWETPTRAYFHFTDSEWELITNAFPSEGSVTHPRQGPPEGAMERTNVVMFVR
jgi:hypothetical protein